MNNVLNCVDLSWKLPRRNILDFKSSSIVEFDYYGKTLLGEVVNIEPLTKMKENVKVLCSEGFLVISNKEIKRVARY